MFRDHYKSLNSQIKPNPQLLINTKNKMYSEISHSKSIKVKRLYPFAAIAVSAGLIIFSVLAVPNLLNDNSKEEILPIVSEFRDKPNTTADPQQNDIIKTSAEIETVLRSGQHKDEVSLTNGILNFVKTPIESTAKLYFDPEKTYQEQWSQEQIVDYFGKDVHPTYIPNQMKEFVKESQTVIFNNDGAVVHDDFSYLYSDNFEDNKASSLIIHVSKEKLPNVSYLYLSEKEMESNINGNELIVGFSKESYGPYDDNKNPTGYYEQYVAEFIYDGVGYRIVSKRLSQEDFINVLLSIIK